MQTEEYTDYNIYLEVYNGLTPIFSDVCDNREDALFIEAIDVIKNFINKKEDLLDSYKNCMALFGLDSCNFSKLPLIFDEEFHEIVENICLTEENNGKKQKEYYIKNAEVFYCMINDFILKTNKRGICSEVNYNGLVKILYEHHQHFTSLLSQYMFEYIPKRPKHPQRSCSNSNTISFTIQESIQNILYSHTPFGAVSDFSTYSSIFLIRAYIENMLRTNFKVSEDTRLMNIGCILNILNENEEAVLTLNNGDNVYKHCKTLDIINQWTNIFVHKQLIPYIWYPYIIFEYLNKLSTDLNDNNKHYYKEVVLSPFIIPECTDTYKTIYEQLRRIQEERKKQNEKREKRKKEKSKNIK